MKRCKFDFSKVCWHNSCGWHEVFSGVVVCPLHPNPHGLFMRKKVVAVESERSGSVG
jgi:hypothetical protein